MSNLTFIGDMRGHLSIRQMFHVVVPDYHEMNRISNSFGANWQLLHFEFPNFDCMDGSCFSLLCMVLQEAQWEGYLSANMKKVNRDGGGKGVVI